MTEAEKRLHRCCFTGHRPEKLRRPVAELQSELEKEIRQAIADGYTVFISGMARGVDIWAAEVVIRLREDGLPLRLICASPYEGFEARWSYEWRDRYYELYTGTEWGKIDSYHLCVDSGKIGINKCVEIICDLYKK